MKLPIAVALLLVAVAVAAHVPAASAAGWVELDLTQTGAASDAALAQGAAGIAVEQYNAQTGSALSLAAVQSAEVFVPADVGRRAVVRVAFTAGEQEGVLRRLLRGPGSTVAVKAEIAGTSHELHRYKLESFSTSG